MFKRSFIKWPGGKFRSINQLMVSFPKDFKTYYEPFLGSGVVCRNVKAENKVVGDVERDLVNAHTQIKNNVEDVIYILDSFVNKEEFYYKIREEFNSDNSESIRQAARFIYLNKCGFNGLYRRNKKGLFNVAFGKRFGDPHKDFTNVRSYSKSLQNVDVRLGDYKKTMEGVSSGDFAYFDPPYVKKSEKSFTGYNSNEFMNTENRKLSDFCRNLDERGVLFAVSNSDTKLVREWYEGFRVREIQTVSSISREGKSRGHCTELLITNY